MNPAVELIPRKLVFRDQEVATLLGVSLRTITRYKHEGRFGGLATAGRRSHITYAGLVGYLQAASECAEK